MVNYSDSDNHVLSNPMFVNLDAIKQFENQKVSSDNLLIRDHNISPIGDRKALGHEGGQKKQSKVKFQEKLEYMQNHITETVTHNHLKDMKNLMMPDYLHAQEMPFQHNKTGEEQNSTGQHSVAHTWDVHVHSESKPSSKGAPSPSNCNFRYSTLH